MALFFSERLSCSKCHAGFAFSGPATWEGRPKVIDHYSGGGIPSPGRSPLIRGFAITEAEKRDLVEFLKSLTDDELLKNPELSDPFR